jgi:hypothetical protein
MRPVRATWACDWLSASGECSSRTKRRTKSLSASHCSSSAGGGGGGGGVMFGIEGQKEGERGVLYREQRRWGLRGERQGAGEARPWRKN